MLLHCSRPVSGLTSKVQDETFLNLTLSTRVSSFKQKLQRASRVENVTGRWSQFPAHSGASVQTRPVVQVVSALPRLHKRSHHMSSVRPAIPQLIVSHCPGSNTLGVKQCIVGRRKLRQERPLSQTPTGARSQEPFSPGPHGHQHVERMHRRHGSMVLVCEGPAEH